MEHFRLGAIDTSANKYTSPQEANKLCDYKCVECDQKVIFKKGKIRVPHFSHYAHSNCTYYDHPNESQIHKDAKMRVVSWLKKGIPIKISKNCNQCRHPTQCNVEYSVDDLFEMEYRFDIEKLYRADVAILNVEHQLKYIIEIKNKHKTDENRRPDPWFEIEAEEIMQKEFLNSIELTDVRSFECKICKEEPMIRQQLLIPFSDFAKTLGYFDHGKWIKKWHSSSIQNNMDVWQVFLTHKRCIRCRVKTKIELGRVYCISCYHSAESDPDFIIWQNEKHRKEEEERRKKEEERWKKEQERRKEIERKGICMCCGSNYSNANPFCQMCRNKIRMREKDKPTITSDRMMELREKLSFMTKIPGGW
jgi:hypothetical protein